MADVSEKKFIDVEQVIHDKNPQLLRFMPGFVLNYIKRVLHQDEINVFIANNSHKPPLEFVEAILLEFGADVSVHGIENLPATGGCIIASNHPLGGLDAMALIYSVALKRKDLRFMVNDVLLQLKNLEELFVGVNKHGKNTGEILESIDRLFKSDIALLIYPAGLVSRKQKGGIIKDLDWKKSFITKARMHKRNIVPVFIGGRNTNFFYNFARLRTRLGIKVNIEMFYLVDEMYRQKGHKVKVVFGKPISWTVFDKRFTDVQWAQKVKDHVYQLQIDAESEFKF